MTGDFIMHVDAVTDPGAHPQPKVRFGVFQIIDPETSDLEPVAVLVVSPNQARAHAFAVLKAAEVALMGSFFRTTLREHKVSEETISAVLEALERRSDQR